MKKIFILCFGIFLCSQVFAQQLTSFPEQDPTFISAVEDFMGKTGRDDVKETAEIFKSVYGGLPIEQKELIKKIANTGLQKSIRAFPEFDAFLRSIIAGQKSSVDATQQTNNMKAQLSLIELGKKGLYKEFSAYNEFLLSWYTNGFINDTKSKGWRYSGSITVTPQGFETYLTLTGGNLSGVTKNDTLTIQETNGKFTVLTSKFEGEKGKIDWSRAGLNGADAYYTFGKYVLNLDESDIKIPEGKLTLKPYFNNEINGSLNDKLLNSKAGKMIYPQFSSAENNMILDKIATQFKFIGGFRLEGSDMYGAGNDSMRATVILFTPKMDTMAVISAQRFLINKFKDVLANDANATIKFGDKTIWHPFVNFRYDMATKNTKLSRENQLYARLPFKSDFQQMNFFVDQLSWNLDSSFIKMNSISATSDNVAVFDSYNFYQKGAETQFRGISDKDPLSALKAYCDMYGVKEIDADEAASAINASLKLSQVENILFKMTAEGFIYYDRENRIVKVLDKTFNYIKAGANLMDYDNMSFTSTARMTHGKVNLKTKEVEVYGVKELKMSKSKNVVFTPTSDTIIIGEDRDITMSGVLTAGKVNFYSKKLKFDYGGFQFDFENVDSMFILIPGKVPDQQGNIPLIECHTAIQNVSGTLYIDLDNNKSGRKNDPRYPYFVCRDSAYVYYDNYPHKEKYLRKDFYFLIQPFEFDSLNTFNTDSVGFPGTFYSGGIFEPFKQELTVQDDLSLGFTMNTGSKGFKMYKGKANYSGRLQLENAGLFGKGDLTFQSATMHGSEFDIYPDSVYADLDSFNIEESKQYNTPQTSTTGGFIKWNPQRDSLKVFRTGDIFTMYKDEVEFKGDLTMGKDYLYGTGSLSWDKATMTAGKIDFKAREFLTPKADIQVKSNDANLFAFTTTNVNAQVNFDTRIAKFLLNDPNTITNLPANNYITNSERYDWDMKNQIITFQNEKANSNFYFQSVDKSQDSISFTAKTAKYDLSSNVLSAEGVTEILLADSKAIPDQGKLTIDKTGRFDNLKNAVFQMSRDTLFHTIKEAEIEIISKNKFVGKGVLNITSPTGDVQKVNIPEFTAKMDTLPEKKKKEDIKLAYYSQGRGSIEESEKFKIDSRVFYKGNVLFNSRQRNIVLDGFARVNLLSDSSDWFAIKQDVNFKRAVLGIDSIYNENKEPLVTGLVLSKEALELYPVIMKAKQSSKDLEIFRSQGVMQYAPQKQAFQFGEDATIKGDYPYGNILTYSENTKDIKATGPIDFHLNVQPVKVESFGDITYTNSTGNLDMNATVALDFFLSETLWPMIHKGISENNTGNLGISYNNGTTIKALYNITPTKNDAIVNATNMQSGGVYQMPTAFPYNIVLTDLKFTFDKEEGTFKSFDKAGLVLIGKRPVHQKINCFLEVGYRGNKDFINLYLETSSGEWYFFRYFEGQLGVVSSSQDFNDAVAVIKPEDTQLKDKKEVIYEFLPASLSIKQSFLDRMTEAKVRLKK